MYDYLIGGIIGAMIGYFIEGFLDKVKNCLAKRIATASRIKISHQLQTLNFKEDAEYMAIDHAVPKYFENNVILNKSSNCVIVPIPNEYRDQLEELGFEYHVGAYTDNPIIAKSFSHINIGSYVDFILEESVNVANEFLEDLQRGKIRFNGYLYGVEHIMLNRYGDNEEPLLKLDFYKTDYFTFRVFANLYKRFRESIIIKGVGDLNNVPAFLSSFGIGCYVIATDGAEEYLVLAHRGDNVIVDKDKYHFSMNEAFSIMDTDIYGNLSFVSCLFRGLREELQLNENWKNQIIDFGFLDLDIIMDRFEMGITCYVKMKFDSEFTMERFRDLYKTAQDKELETKGLFFIPMRNIRDFMKVNESKFSIACINGLRSLLVRYESKQI